MSRLSTSLQSALVLVAFAALLVPVWGFDYFPSQDGPTHLENAQILLRLRGVEVLRLFYEINPEPVPNWFATLFLAAAMKLTGPAVAEKLFLSFYVLGLPLAFVYFVRSVKSEAREALFLVLPFVYNHILFLGFFNQAIATLPYFLVLGYWIRFLRQTAPGRAATLRAVIGVAMLLLWVYSCHLVVTILALGGLLAATAWVVFTESAHREFARICLRRLGLLGLAALPTALLVLRFLSRQGAVEHRPGPDLLERWTELWRLGWLVSFDRWEVWLATSLSVCLAGLLGALLGSRIRRRSFEIADLFLLLALVHGLLYFTVGAAVIRNPRAAAGGDSVHGRVGLFVFFALIAWIATQARLRGLLLVVGLAWSGAFLLVRIPRHAEMNGYFEEYLSIGPLLPSSATVLPLGYAPTGRRADGSHLSTRVLPFLHVSGYLAVERGIVDFLNFAANLGYFPIVYREAADPYYILGGGVEGDVPCVSLKKYRHNRGAKRIDFVVIWDPLEADVTNECVVSAFRQVRGSFVLVGRSAPRGLAEVYERRSRRPALSPAQECEGVVWTVP